MIDVIAVAYYIRSLGAYTSFAFTEDTLSVLLSDEKVLLYPTDSTPMAVTYVTGEGKPLNQEQQQDVIALNTSNNQALKRYQELLMVKRIIAIGIILSGAIIGMIVIHLASVKRKKA